MRKLATILLKNLAPRVGIQLCLEVQCQSLKKLKQVQDVILIRQIPRQSGLNLQIRKRSTTCPQKSLREQPNAEVSSKGSTLRWKSTRAKSMRDQVENIYCPPKIRKLVLSKKVESQPTGLCPDKSTRVDPYLVIPQNTQSRKSRRLNLVILNNS